MIKDGTIQLPFGSAQLNSKINKTDISQLWTEKWNSPVSPDQMPISWLGDQPTLNRAMLERLNELDSSGNLTRKLISMYFDFSAHTLEQLRHMVEQPGVTPNDLARHLHSLKSSSANLGLDRVSTILQQLEYTSYTDAKFSPTVGMLSAEIEKGNLALNEWLAEH